MDAIIKLTANIRTLIVNQFVSKLRAYEIATEIYKNKKIVYFL